MKRAEEPRTEDVYPAEVPLEIALDICAGHGLEQRKATSAWRVWFLAKLRRTACIRQALRACAMSPCKLYREMERLPVLRVAADMAIGRIPWDEAAWDEAVLVARQCDGL